MKKQQRTEEVVEVNGKKKLVPVCKFCKKPIYWNGMGLNKGRGKNKRWVGNFHKSCSVQYIKKHSKVTEREIQQAYRKFNKKMKKYLIWLTVGIVAMFILGSLVVKGIERGIDINEIYLCQKWSRYANEYHGFYLTEWQAQMCEYHGITINAPVF